MPWNVYCHEFLLDYLCSVSGHSAAFSASFLMRLMLFRTLWAFDILPPLNEFGKPILPDIETMDGHLSVQPREFAYRLVPRRANTASVIVAEAARAEEELVSWT